MGSSRGTGIAAVATRIADARPGARLDIIAVVTAVATTKTGPSVSFRATVRDDDGGYDDGPGGCPGDAAQLDLLFLGRPRLLGLVVGARCHISGRAVTGTERLTVWNPEYRVLATAPGETEPAAHPTEPESAASREPAASPQPGTASVPLAPSESATVTPAGRFRIYLGPSAGVGKTVAMLKEGHRRRARGTDTVIAFVDTHDRIGTQSEVPGLEEVPPKTVEYQGSRFQEMDLDAVLARAPELALVDELAHTNVPGSGRNEKRWQDVQELLAAGINVISTVNIQHIESLADVVEEATGIAVRERIPDAVLRKADQIELVDSSPQQLRRRMVHGNIYPPNQAEEALKGFFRVDNLTTLRELTLRFLADDTDEDLRNYFQRATGERRWDTAERILIGVIGAPAPGMDAALRRGARIANRLKAGFHVAYVGPSDHYQSDATEAALQRLRQLTDDLGGNWLDIYDDDPVGALMQLATDQGATQIVLGPTKRKRGGRLFGRSPVDRLTQMASEAGIDIHLIAHAVARPAADHEQSATPGRSSRARRSVGSVGEDVI